MRLSPIRLLSRSLPALARTCFSACDKRVPALTPEPALPQRVLATGPLPSTHSSSAISHRLVHGFIGTMRPSEYSHSCIVRPERLPPLHARDPPLCPRRRFRVSMSPPMFQGWLYIHKKV